MKIYVLLLVLQVCRCLPVEKSVSPPPKNALDFMKQYGYLKQDKLTSAALYTEEGLSEAIKTVQKFGALEETGKLDNATLELMSTPRCGNPDVFNKRRSKRFALTSGWNKRHITYYIANWSPKIGEEAVSRIIAKALNAWGTYGSLKFSRKTTPDADIIVSFARGAHGDPFPFDGPGYVLAHAYFPNSGSAISGDIHFDDDENWVHGSLQDVIDGGTDFYSVALHELGHSLGLAHSNDPRSVMFAYYKGDDESSLQLSQDDIMAMYQLYIARPIQETTLPTTAGTTRRTRPYNTRPPNESPRTRPPEHTTKPTSRQSTTRVYTDHTSTIHTRAPTYVPSETERTRTYYPSTRYPTTRFGSTTRETTRSTFTTTSPSTLYPSWQGNEGETRRTTHSRWFTTSQPDHTTSNRFTSTSTNTKKTTMRDTERQDTAGTTNRRPSYTVPKYPTSAQSTTVPPEPNICEGRFDSVANLRGEIFVFKNEYIWRLQDRNRIVPGYPVLLRQMFPKLPDYVKKLDAVYQRPDGNMVLFTGDRYWVYDGTNFVENSPRYVQDYGVPLGIGGIDAVQTWARNGETYLYRGDVFWRYNEKSKTPDTGYPKHIKKWRGIPRNIDAALTWKDGKTYFFKDDQYWIFNNKRVIATSDSPRSATREWLGCP